jgi:hypothetical protein
MPGTCDSGALALAGQVGQANSQGDTGRQATGTEANDGEAKERDG